MLEVGELTAERGEQTFGYLEVTASRSGMQPDIPVHLVAGAEPGPTLLVQGAIHGEEVVGSVAILDFIENLDPAELRGNVIAVPVVNRVGMDLRTRWSEIDGKDISMLFPGDSEGSVSEQVAHTYFTEVIEQSDVMLDFHAGGRTAYERYVLFSAEKDPENPTEIEKRRRKLVVAFGLDRAAFFPPGTFDMDEGKVAIEDAGVAQITLELGGGTGWFEHGEENVRDAERGMWNTLKNPTEIEKRRRKLVAGFGLDKAAYFPPGTFGANDAKQAIEDADVTQITLEFGGGTGWFEHGEENVRDAERGMWNTLKVMEMVDGELEADGPKCTVYEAGTVIWKPDVDGLFIREKTIGDELDAGDVYGRLVDPYTGNELTTLTAPEDGTVIPSGQNWLTIGATSVGILGRVDRVDDRREMDLTIPFDD